MLTSKDLYEGLKSKLLFTVSALVIGSGLLISFTVTQRFSNALFQGMTTEARDLTPRTQNPAFL